MAEVLSFSEIVKVGDGSVSKSSPSDVSPDRSIGPETSLNDLIQLFGSKNIFWSKVAIYTKTVTHGNVKFNFEELVWNGEESKLFLVLKIRKPSSYRKGIPVSDLAEFFDVDVVVNRPKGDGATPRRRPPDLNGGESGE